jgi:ABC-type Fe3+/spermidine/putrescine transport system ATPase subunit
MSLEIKNLRVSYGQTRALDGVSCVVETGELFFILGPSGCGKSTLLRTVAGYIEEFEGEIKIDGQSLKGVAPHLRDFGMVFQNYALFPHLTAAENVAFGLEARKVAAAELSQRVREALDLVGLSGLAERRPGELSGGQQQRVALARALVIRPRLLLLDEPLSNLDAKLRWEMREEIRRIHKQTQITTLYVTHDQKEALALAGRLAILNEGRLNALGKPRDLYQHPPTRFSAAFLGEINALAGKVLAGGKVATACGEIEVPHSLPVGAPIAVFCRPESVHVSLETDGLPPESFQPLAGSARVVSGAFCGGYTLYEISLPGEVRWRVSRPDHGSALAEGALVKVAVDGRALAVLE